MMKGYQNERETVARFMTRLYDRQLTTASGGNLSMRLDDGLFCITPSALDKGCLRPEDIAIVTLEGENLTPDLKLSIETEMHRLTYLARPDANAIVHAHPVKASAFSAVMPCMIDVKMTAETYFILGDVENVPYALMGTKELAVKVSESARTHDVMLMENHGVLTLGKTMLNAFDKLELLERSAEMTIISHQLRSFGIETHSLNEDQCRILDSMKTR